MCLEKPSFTERPIRPVRERIDLLKQDASLTSKEIIKEIIHTEVRGGRGNTRLMGWTSGRIDDKETLFVTVQREEPLYDYRRGFKQHEAWSNIEVGKDIYNLTEKQKNGLRVTLSLLISSVTLFFIYLIL